MIRKHKKSIPGGMLLRFCHYSLRMASRAEIFTARDAG